MKKSENRIFIIAKSKEEVQSFRSFWPASFFERFLFHRIGLPSPDNNFPIACKPWHLLFFSQLPAAAIDKITYFKQKVMHFHRLDLIFLFMQENQFPKNVSVAEPMSAVERKIWFPEIVNDTAAEVRQNVEMIHRFNAAFFMDTVKSESVCPGCVEPVWFICNAGAAFIDMQDRTAAEGLSESLLKGSEVVIAPSGGIWDSAFTDRCV